jgi:hypothetical protein
MSAPFHAPGSRVYGLGKLAHGKGLVYQGLGGAFVKMARRVLVVKAAGQH